MIKNEIKLVLLACAVLLTNTSCANQSSVESKKNQRDSDGLLVGLDPRVKKLALEHREAIKRIDQSYDERALGDANIKAGNYEQALDHYLKARELTEGPKGVIMTIIAEAYEKLGRYDDAIAILQESIDTNQWNEEGKANTRALIERYEALRSSRQESSPSDPKL